MSRLTDVGSGEWVQLSQEIELPDGVAPSSLEIRCVALVRRGSEHAVTIDGMAIEVLD